MTTFKTRRIIQRGTGRDLSAGQEELSIDSARDLIRSLEAAGLDCRDLIREFESRFPGKSLEPTEPKRSPGNPGHPKRKPRNDEQIRLSHICRSP